MLVKVLGVRELDFPDNNGKRVKGTQIFVSYPAEKVDGEICEKVFVSEKNKNILPVFKFGEQYELVFEIKSLAKNARAELTKILTKDGKPCPNVPFNGNF